MGGRSCRTKEVPELQRLYCSGDNNMTVRILEEAWPGRPLIPRDCLCSGPSAVGATETSFRASFLICKLPSCVLKVFLLTMMK